MTTRRRRKRAKAVDPVEKIIADALTAAGISFDPAPSNKLDFHLTDSDVYIEVKRFHAERIVRQMGRVENVIAIQGLAAAQTFAVMIDPGRKDG